MVCGFGLVWFAQCSCLWPAGHRAALPVSESARRKVSVSAPKPELKPSDISLLSAPETESEVS